MEQRDRDLKIQGTLLSDSKSVQTLFLISQSNQEHSRGARQQGSQNDAAHEARSFLEKIWKPAYFVGLPKSNGVRTCTNDPKCRIGEPVGALWVWVPNILDLLMGVGRVRCAQCFARSRQSYSFLP